MPVRRHHGIATLVAAFSIAVIAIPAGASLAASSGTSSSAQARAATPTPTPSPSGSPTGPTGIKARAWELYDITAGHELAGHDATTKLPMASITKIMTALIVIKSGDLNRVITISKADVAYVQSGGASNAGLRAGDRLTASQLLYAMLLPSGADAARALAVTYGPGWVKFVGKMNTEAKALHLTGTAFSNFDGLPWPTNTSDHSTPADLINLG